MGLISMAWVARIPEIKSSIGLSNGQFGVVILGSTVGSIAGAQIAGRAMHSFGSRPVINFSAIIMPAGLFAMALANTGVELFFALMVMGFGYAITDMCLNYQAVVVERILEKKWMLSFHGMWSLGAFIVTVFGGVISSEISPRSNLMIAAIVGAGAFIPVNLTLLSPAIDGHSGDGEQETEGKVPFFARSVIPLWAIGIGLVASLIAEGSAGDWGGLLLENNMSIGGGLTASAFGAFALAMIVSRLTGDRIIHKFGARNTVKLGGLVGGLGWAIALLIAIPLSSSHPLPALIIADIGFAFAGFGIGPMFPAFILAASRIPGISSAVAISRVGLIGIAGFFIGPTVTGGIAEVTSLSYAIFFPVAALVFAGFMARAIKSEAKA
jgi:MFS family permease